MSDTNTNIPLREDANVIELLAILEERGRPSTARDFRELVEQVGSMERQLDAAAKEIAAMRRELAELRDFHGEPLHTEAKRNIDTASRQITQAREWLGRVKDRIVQGAKGAVAAVRGKGIGALNNAMSFLGVKDDLQAIREGIDKNTKSCDRSLARVDAISRQYHEVGTAARNFGRALTGKEVRDDTRDSGRLAKVAAAPFHTLKTLYSGLAKGVDAALGRLEKLEQAAKPSMLENLQSMKETAAREQGMALSTEKTKNEPSL